MVWGFAERWDEGYKFNLGVSADQWQQSNLDLRLWIPEQVFHVTHTDDTSAATLEEEIQLSERWGINLFAYIQICGHETSICRV